MEEKKKVLVNFKGKSPVKLLPSALNDTKVQFHAAHKSLSSAYPKKPQAKGMTNKQFENGKMFTHLVEPPFVLLNKLFNTKTILKA